MGRLDTGNVTAQTRQHKVNAIVDAPFIDTYVPKHQYGPDYVISSENLYTSEPDGHVKLEISSNANFAPKSLVTLLRERMESNPSLIALVVKRNGEWRKWTYTQYWMDVRTSAKAFIKLGLKAFRGIAILGSNAPEWFFAHLGAIFAGGLPIGIYTTNSPEACFYILNHSLAQIAVVENEDQLKKILEVRNRLPHLKFIIQYSGEPTHPDVLSWQDLMKIGKSLSDDILDKRIRGLAVNQCCTLIYTAGTTGNPKPVMLSHDNMICGMLIAVKGGFHLTYESMIKSGVYDSVKGISYLPLNHIAAQMADIYVAIYGGKTIYFAPPGALKDGFLDFVKEVKPHYLLGVPRVWEKIYEKLKDAEMKMNFARRMVFKWSQSLGHSYMANLKKGNADFPRGYSVAKSLVFNKIKKALGFDEMLFLASGAAPISEDIINYFMDLSLYMFELYGQSESAGPVTASRIDSFEIGSVGQIEPIVEVMIQKPNSKGEGEICLRGRMRFMGYCKMPEETAATITKDGWLLTGDIGKVNNNNFLYITGRMKEIIVTAGGENIPPVQIEDFVKRELPIISQAMLVGDRKKFLSMLLTLKTEVDDQGVPTNILIYSSQAWCRERGSNAKKVEDILHEPGNKILKAIQHGIDQVNANAFSNAHRIQKWVILPNDFTTAGGELTPTQKLRRGFVLDKYSTQISKLYE